MSLRIEPLQLSANQWQFLSRPEAYVAACKASGRPLELQSTRRQFRTAKDLLERLVGSHGQEARRGILLADDVGLGKTTVAALVAWVFASAGSSGRRVRILAPNEVMQRRWVEELRAHVAPLQFCAPSLDVAANHVKERWVRQLKAKSIQVLKHSYAISGQPIHCDLLIVDEAHRAKGDGCQFGEALKHHRKSAGRVLILTATPFSIRLAELNRMLALIGGEEAQPPVRKFSRALDDLYKGHTSRSAEAVAKNLAEKAGAAVEALSHFVIRHGIDDLPREERSFGSTEEWDIAVPKANRHELELMLRMDRALRLLKGAWSFDNESGATNDPRFHVGWQHFDEKLDQLNRSLPSVKGKAAGVARGHVKAMRSLKKKVGPHTKMVAVKDAVSAMVDVGEKVLVFCHHIATAQELTAYLAKQLLRNHAPSNPPLRVWRQAWEAALPFRGESEQHARRAFIHWLCSDLNRGQTSAWLGKLPATCSATRLRKRLADAPCRNRNSRISIADAAGHLFEALVKSKSSLAVLNAAAVGSPCLIPGANGAAPVLGVCEPGDQDASLFLRNRQPDTVISIFNSPFGPDVLVVTDRLSEGVDLHRYCRHLVHYELDASPIRTVQRNGRLRRVRSWASVTGEPICNAYPAFGGTRDHKMVQIMKKRITSFSLLLGGVRDFDVDQVHNADELWRNDVISKARLQLQRYGRSLCAR